MHKHHAFAIISICLLLLSCNTDNDLSTYYFPLEELNREAKVYEYEYRLKDTTIKSYWYYQTIKQQQSVYLVSTCYDAQFNQLLLMREEKVKNGMRLADMYFYGVNTEGYTTRTQAKVEGGAVFPFEVKDSNSVFVNIITYKDAKDTTLQTTLTRNRRFLRPISYKYKDKEYKSLLFEMKEEQAVKDAKQGGIAPMYKIEEIYAKNIGLVYTKRYLSDSDFIECRLLNITTMPELETRFKKNIQKQ